LRFNWINVYSGSKLAEDLDAQHGTFVRDFLHGTREHLQLSGTVGVLLDRRNHESTPSDGSLSQISTRGGVGYGERFAFGGFTAEHRHYLSIWDEYLVFAGRLLADFLFGQVPLYELPRVGGLQPDGAGGGHKSMRGIVNNRYCGKIKLLANAELRAKIIHFTVFEQRFNVGAVGFFDVGRVFTDFDSPTALDGSDFGAKVGTGGGLRLQWGEHFIIRADFGYSPTEGSLGQYITIDHAF
jgi:outer membrane protein assembly factor BamA